MLRSDRSSFGVGDCRDANAFTRPPSLDSRGFGHSILERGEVQVQGKLRGSAVFCDMFLSLERVACTGCNSFVNWWRTGDRVRAFSRKRYAAFDALGVESVTGDIQDAVAVRGACEGQEVVFHTAAIAGVSGGSGRLPEPTHWELATWSKRAVTRACRSWSTPVVQVSRSTARINATWISAVWPDQWLCHYPHSKALAEQHVKPIRGTPGFGDASASDLGTRGSSFGAPLARTSRDEASCVVWAMGPI